MIFMGFDTAAYEQLAKKIQDGVSEVQSGMAGLESSVAGLHDISPLLIAPAVITWVVNAMTSFLKWLMKILKFINDLLEGILAPLFFLFRSFDFRGEVAKAATDSAGLINGLPIGKGSNPLWQGRGAETYKGKIAAQASAASALGDLCEELGVVCFHLAVGGFSLYNILALLVATITGALAALGVEFGTVFGSVAAPPTAAGFTTILIFLANALTAAFEFLLILFDKMAEMNSKVQDNTNFSGPPLGSWPIAVTEGSKGVMDDATVTDGDADWSVPKR